MISIDLPKMCIRDLFPGLSIREADTKMVEAVRMMEKWYHENTSDKELQFRWVNILEVEENPFGEIGFIQVFKNK